MSQIEQMPEPALEGGGMGSGGGEAAIQTVGLTKRFRRVLAVDGVDLTVPRGKTYGLIGLNGAGKSTAIRLLVGLEVPTSGRCLLGGMDVQVERLKWKNMVGFVPDRPTAYPWMRAGEVLKFAQALRPHWNSELVDRLVKKSRIDLGQKVGKLSKGTGAKLMLILALAHDPEILILDEPTDGLDPIAREEFCEDVLTSICQRPRTVLLSSHALTDVGKMVEIVGVMHKGRLIVQCPTEELVDTTKRIRSVLPDGGVPQPPAGTVYSKVEGREWVLTVRGCTRTTVEKVQAGGIRTVEVVDLNLEEVFKDIVRGQEVAA